MSWSSQWALSFWICHQYPICISVCLISSRNSINLDFHLIFI
jgi:hypothetical protein